MQTVSLTKVIPAGLKMQDMNNVSLVFGGQPPPRLLRRDARQNTSQVELQPETDIPPFKQNSKQ